MKKIQSLFVDRPFLSVVIKFVLLFGVILGFEAIVLGDNYVFGSYVDWNSQHAALPEYFRQKFYECGSFSDFFALELGAGLNPYALSYHGMLNPVLLPSYLLPWVSMYDYIIVSSVVLWMMSVVLMYIWLKKNEFSDNVAFLCAVLFAISSPLFYHFHKQVMFVDYMPFLLLSLISIDEMLLKRKKLPFAISFALSIMTSFFYTVGMVVCVCIYYVYRYLKIHNGIGKRVWRDIGGFAFSGAVACSLTGILTIPSIYALVAGRGSNSSETYSLFDILLPDFDPSKLLYSAYGAGLTLIVVFALFLLLFLKKKHTAFLSVSLCVLWLFPIFSVVMNGFLYDRGKIYIVLLPVLVLALAEFFQNVKCVRINVGICAAFLCVVVLLYAVSGGTYRLLIVIEAIAILLGVILLKYRGIDTGVRVVSLAVAAVMFVYHNIPTNADYLDKQSFDYLNSDVQEQLLSDYADDGECVRVADLTGKWYTCNKTYGKGLLRSSVYASSSDVEYMTLINSELHLTSRTLNKITAADVNDALWATFMGQKYLIGYDYTDMYGYSVADKHEDTYLYVNENAYSIGFAGNNVMSLREFRTLNGAEARYALLSYIIVDTEMEDVYSPVFEKLDIEDKIPLEYFENMGYTVDSDEKVKFSIELEDGLENKLYAVHLHFDEMERYEISVTVNKIKNRLSSSKNAFPNDNYDFWMIVSSEDVVDSLDFTLSAGNYSISEFEIYSADARVIDEAYENMQMAYNVVYNGSDTLSCSIDMPQDGYFMFTVNTNNGITLYVDGEEREIETLDSCFVGCAIESGTHEIVLKYDPPLRNIGAGFSVFGICSMVFLGFWDNRRKFKLNRKGSNGSNGKNAKLLEKT